MGSETREMATLTQPISQELTSRDMKIGLFIPCYIDLVYPEVGIATFGDDKAQGIQCM
jgi:hypothetical protein